MKQFTFTHKNTSDVFITNAIDFNEAEFTLKTVLIDVYGWRVNDEEGLDEDDDEENALFI